ncbi:cyclic nucleotide-binding domain-containing protein [Ramlibacter sp. WS9]|uniref:cyclic nucleotide-binding domain-containing protein n=1 Tax=Ramlibacter sp. WS9 TaxID=1882741 RepID=UPI001E2CAE87|nr:cyclic nucleotide-binding domain-containing protein [Ramlibacter sp. WS9]
MSHGFGLGQWAWDWRLAWHACAALLVVVLARLLQLRWKAVPGLFPAVVIVALLIALSGFGSHFVPAASTAAFAWPPLPDWQGVPWAGIVSSQGTRLVSLALLMALVNSLDILVFNQELDLEHGLLHDPNATLRRESLIGAACALLGMIPASTSASRSRIALSRAGAATNVSPIHAAIMLAVAATGQWWLHWVPMACFAGALILAGITQVPSALWSRRYAADAPAVWTQSWLVALVFATAGGAGALIAGLVVATFVLMRASASTALRRALLDGEVRSRRLRRAASEAWLAPHMRRLAVVELQGVMSFGVSAHLAEQVKQSLRPDHDRLILDASRVAAWDTTAWVRMGALARDLAQRRVETAMAGAQMPLAGANAPALKVFADLDRALEWAEEAMLEERRPEDRPAYPANDVLGEIGDGLPPHARAALEARLVQQTLAPHEQAFTAGAAEADIVVVQSGRVTLSTAWPPASGMRLATVGQGMAFGEMAFLTQQPRTACAGAESDEAQLVRLSRPEFDAWAADHPAEALTVMGNLAIIGTRRLGATTRQLRAVLE